MFGKTKERIDKAFSIISYYDSQARNREQLLENRILALEKRLQHYERAYNVLKLIDEATTLPSSDTLLGPRRLKAAEIFDRFNELYKHLGICRSSTPAKIELVKTKHPK